METLLGFLLILLLVCSLLLTFYIFAEFQKQYKFDRHRRKI